MLLAQKASASSVGNFARREDHQQKVLSDANYNFHAKLEKGSKITFLNRAWRISSSDKRALEINPSRKVRDHINSNYTGLW